MLIVNLILLGWDVETGYSILSLIFGGRVRKIEVLGSTVLASHHRPTDRNYKLHTAVGKSSYVEKRARTNPWYLIARCSLSMSTVGYVCF
jgi:hypothetical protein